jgi:hypothetical protein
MHSDVNSRYSYIMIVAKMEPAAGGMSTVCVGKFSAALRACCGDNPRCMSPSVVRTVVDDASAAACDDRLLLARRAVGAR